MATYSVIVAKHATLAASTVDTVNFSGGSTVAILNRGTSDIFFSFASSAGTAATPVVGGDDTFISPTGQQVVVRTTGGAPITQVKLISVGTPSYSAEVVT